MVTSRKEAMLSRGVRERIVTARMWIRGKRGTRKETTPRKRVTVCAGRSCEKATRKEIWRGMEPLMDVRLYREVHVRN